MDLYLKDALEKWREEIYEYLQEIDKEYEEVKQELQIYNYKFSITKQVVQSTINQEINRNIRELYHQPFEQKFNKLKEDVKALEERKKVFLMFIEKIDKVTQKLDVEPYSYT